MKPTGFAILALLLCLTTIPIPPVSLSYETDGISNGNGVLVPDLISASPIAPLAPRMIRVAVYNETNTTRPSYSTIGLLSDNMTGIRNVLLAAGYEVTLVTKEDILDHELMTSRYDVFVMVDNLPREAIVNFVKEFWLGGGGVLSLDSAISFVCYAGMIPPESEGSENHGVYWDYGSWFSENDITARHPATGDFHIGDTATTSSMDWAIFYWAAITATSVAADLVRLGSRAGAPNDASMVALDPTIKGGRVIQLPCSGNPITGNMSMVIRDAVDWLCPRPKARILFDLSHEAHWGIDSWDPLTHFKPRLSDWRNAMVNHSFTLDKLYPGAIPSLTPEVLAPYDILVVLLPYDNFTASEVSVVADWVAAGGSLFAMGDNIALASNNNNINYLLSFTGLRLNNDVDSPSDNIDDYDVHPTTESCSDLYFGTAGLVNYTGMPPAPQYRIWGPDPYNTVVAGVYSGHGRVLLATDINWLGDPVRGQYLDEADNYQYAVNVANWLSASDADTLLYVDEPFSTNRYKTPVCQALDDLGVSFALTFESDYFNLSLNLYEWNLVIVDNPWYSVSSYLDEIGQYVDSGGRLLFSGYQVSNLPSDPLWAKLGFAYAAPMPGSAPVHIWDHAHDIFTQPNLYSSNNFTPTIDYGDEGDLLTVYANATALAGCTSSDTPDQAIIVLRNDGNTLYNGYLIDQFAGDLDDSTYQDRLELWENEIAYMLRPIVQFDPLVVSTVNQGTVLTVNLSLENMGLRAASSGFVTLSAPGLGSLLSGPTQLFPALGPSATDTLSWSINVTGVGDFVLSFTAGYDGLPGTTYTDAFTANTHAVGIFDIVPSFLPSTTVVEGSTLKVNLTIRDATGAPVTDAVITATFAGATIGFVHIGTGVYQAVISVPSGAAIRTLSVTVSKADFTTASPSYAISVTSSLNILLVAGVVAAVLVVLLVILLRKRRG